MSWTIDREGLHQFIDQAIDTIMSTPMATEAVEALLAAGAPYEILEAAYGAWIAAGMSVEIGNVLRNDPERFIIEVP